MARKSSMAKDRKQRRLVKLGWTRRQELKAIVKDLSKGEDERLAARIALGKLPRNASPVRVRNRCQFTGRVRGFLRKFKMSRLCFREMANQGFIPGVYKASW